MKKRDAAIKGTPRWTRQYPVWGSPKEEGALRRVKSDIAALSALPGREVERLKRLDLVEQRGHW